MESLLKIEGLTKSFGNLVALDNVSFEINSTEIVGIIGPNGAGKTTAINLITGYYRKDSGKVFIKNKNITNYKTHEIVREGLVRTFQITKVFGNLTVRQNLEVVSKNSEEIDKTLKFLCIDHIPNIFARNASYGQKKLIELARILLLNPSIVILDEPGAGINPILLEDIKKRILNLRDKEGKTLIIIEHDMKTINDLCDRVIVLDHGKLLAEGKFEKIAKMKEVQEAYFGKV